MAYYRDLAEMYVGDDVSPDFYGWVFPKYDHVAVGELQSFFFFFWEAWWGVGKKKGSFARATRAREGLSLSRFFSSLSPHLLLSSRTKKNPQERAPSSTRPRSSSTSRRRATAPP